MTGTNLTSSAVVANPGANWKAVGTGDFDDDGHADILLQNTNGAVAVWETDGTKVTTSAVVANPGASWKAVGTGDFNSDSHSDILLQNADGRVAIWEMIGTTMIQQRDCQLQSRAQLARDRDETAAPTSVSEHERPNRDLGHERNHRHRRRGFERQRRAKLAGGWARLILDAGIHYCCRPTFRGPRAALRSPPKCTIWQREKM